MLFESGIAFKRTKLGFLQKIFSMKSSQQKVWLFGNRDNFL